MPTGVIAVPGESTGRSGGWWPGPDDGWQRGRTGWQHCTVAPLCPRPTPSSRTWWPGLPLVTRQTSVLRRDTVTAAADTLLDSASYSARWPRRWVLPGLPTVHRCCGRSGSLQGCPRPHPS